MTARNRPPARQGLSQPDSGMHPTTPAPAPHRLSPVPTGATCSDTGDMNEQVLYTADQAATLLQVRPSWLRRKAAARALPCRYLGKHLRFTRADINAIAEASAQPPRQRRRTLSAADRRARDGKQSTECSFR